MLWTLWKRHCGALSPRKINGTAFSRRGRDPATVAAVAGGLAGVLYGAEDIPEEWLDGLIRREAIEKLCKQFAESKAS